MAVMGLLLGLLLVAQTADPLAGFETTGETKRCVHSYEINQTRVLDDATVLFRLRVRDEWVNRLRQPCPLLKITGGFSYKVQGGTELCRGDVIRVLDPAGTGSACLLGDFQRVTEKQRDPKIDQPSSK